MFTKLHDLKFKPMFFFEFFKLLNIRSEKSNLFVVSLSVDRRTSEFLFLLVKGRSSDVFDKFEF